MTHFHKLCAIQSTIGLVRYDHSNETVDNYLNVHTDARYHHTAHPSSENVVEAVASRTRSSFSPCETIKNRDVADIFVRQLSLFQCRGEPIIVRSAYTKGVEAQRPETFTFSRKHVRHDFHHVAILRVMTNVANILRWKVIVLNAAGVGFASAIKIVNA